MCRLLKIMYLHNFLKCELPKIPIYINLHNNSRHELSHIYFKRELHNIMCLHFFLGVVFWVLHTFEKSMHIIASFNLLMIEI